ncbi:MAG: choice-of-anchor Q domain-containing protein [Thermoleophilaceae bacterium]
MGKALWPALVAAILLAVPSTASAAVIRHASPDGVDTVSTCTDGEQPCSLKRAVETVATNGDEVVLAPGVYSPPSTVNISKPIFVHGQDGQPAPRVVRSAGQVFGVAGGGTLAYVQAESVGPVLDVVSVAERVTVLSAAGASMSSAVTVHGGGILRDSFVRAESPNGRAVLASYGIVNLVNVTAIAIDAGSSALYTDPSVGGICVPDSQIELHATNVIARGGKYDVDVPALCYLGGPARHVAFMTHSNYRRAKVHESRPDSHVEEGGGNQDVEPLFASPPALDVHQLAGSPTIDAGVATPQLGTGDIDGQARTQGSAPDIGADEHVPPPPAVDTDRPVASLLRVAPGRFRAAAARRRAGARISYALDEDATVTFTAKRIIQRVVRGRRRTSYRPMRGSFEDAGEAGGNSLRFSGRVGGRRLRLGLYRLIALPVDAAGNTGNAALARFRIKR